MLDANTYSVIGLYLTLLGLLGTFFYVHLGGWLQDMLKLYAKWNINKPGTDAAQITGKRECRFELEGLFNHIPVLAAIIVGLFICVLFKDANDLLAQAPNDALAARLTSVFNIFVLSYYVLTAYLLFHGLVLGFKMKYEMKK